MSFYSETDYLCAEHFKVFARESNSKLECFLVDTNPLQDALYFANLALQYMNSKKQRYPNCFFEIYIEWAAKPSKFAWRGTSLYNSPQHVALNDIWVHPLLEQLRLSEQDLLLDLFCNIGRFNAYATDRYFRDCSNPLSVVRICP